MNIKDAKINDEIINKARFSIEGMYLQNISEFSEFQKYLMQKINLDLTVLKESLRKDMENEK